MKVIEANIVQCIPCSKPCIRFTQIDLITHCMNSTDYLCYECEEKKKKLEKYNWNNNRNSDNSYGW